MESCRTLMGHEGGILCLGMSSNGSYLLSGSQDRKILLWNVDNGKKIATFDGHAQSVRDLAVSCICVCLCVCVLFFLTFGKVSKDSALMVSGGQDKTLLFWDITRVAITRKIRAHDAEINCVRLNNAGDASVVITGGADKRVHIWDGRSRSFAPVQSLIEATDGVTSISTSPTQILSTSLDGKCRQYDIRAGKLRVDDIGPSVMSGCYSNDFNCILTSTLDSRVRLFDKAEGELLNEYKVGIC